MACGGPAVALAALVATAVSATAAEPMQLTVTGQTRTYLLERPAVHGPRPTVIMLHGARSAPAIEAQSFGLARLASVQGFAAIFPEGRGARWNFHPPGQETAVDVQFFQQHGGVPDDVAFLKAIVIDLVRRGISDPKRVYLAGRSLGGVMALRMACIDAGMFAAMGLLISAMAHVNGVDCRPAKPLPALMVAGTDDRLIPYGGGRSERGDMVWAAESLVAFFRRLNGCGSGVQTSSVWNPQRPRIEVEFSRTCEGGPVAFYRVVGGGHEVPAVLNGGDMLLEFFRDKSR